jgi:uncharacterized Zn finger protein
MIDTTELQMRVIIQSVLEYGTTRDKEELIKKLSEAYFYAHRLLKEEMRQNLFKRQ